MLKLDRISKSFQNERETLTVLQDLSLNIDKGQIISIIGKSGSGKSTLLNVIGGLIKPDSGTISIYNKEFTYNNDFSKFRSKLFGYVFQTHNLLPEFTVIENLLLPLIINNSKINYTDSYSKAENLLKIFNLQRYLNSYPGNLSHGENQRVSIIRSFISNPEIIIADEPTANLDENNCQTILDLFVKLNNEHQCSFIIATHDHSFRKISNTVYKIKNKKLEKNE